MLAHVSSAVARAAATSLPAGLGRCHPKGRRHRHVCRRGAWSRRRGSPSEYRRPWLGREAFVAAVATVLWRSAAFTGRPGAQLAVGRLREGGDADSAAAVMTGDDASDDRSKLRLHHAPSAVSVAAAVSDGNSCEGSCGGGDVQGPVGTASVFSGTPATSLEPRKLPSLRGRGSAASCRARVGVHGQGVAAAAATPAARSSLYRSGCASSVSASDVDATPADAAAARGVRKRLGRRWLLWGPPLALRGLPSLPS